MCVFICTWNGWMRKTYVENLETGDIQYTDKVLPLLLGIQGLVTLLHQPLEQPVEHRLRHGAYGVSYLVLVTTLGDELVTDLDPWLQQVLVKIGTVATKQLGHAITFLQCEEKLDFLFYNLSRSRSTRRAKILKKIYILEFKTLN